MLRISALLASIVVQQHNNKAIYSTTADTEDALKCPGKLSKCYVHHDTCCSEMKGFFSPDSRIGKLIHSFPKNVFLNLLTAFCKKVNDGIFGSL